jgi:hypothetical protein
MGLSRLGYIRDKTACPYFCQTYHDAGGSVHVSPQMPGIRLQGYGVGLPAHFKKPLGYNDIDEG